MAESTRKSTGKKISIVLPKRSKDEMTTTSSSLRRDDDSDDEFDSSLLSNSNLSVTSYIVQHSKRNSRGNYIPQMYNELASFVNFNTMERARAPTIGWVHTRDANTLASKIKTKKKEVKMNLNCQIDEAEIATKERDSSSPPPESITPLTSRSELSLKENEIVTSNKLPFPAIRYQRPQVAVQNKIIDFSNVPLLRRQISALHTNHNNEKYRKDFARTSHDIYRLKLNRPETTRGHFRDVCITYLATSPGSSSAITGQLG